MRRSLSLLLAFFLLASCTTNTLSATPPGTSLAFIPTRLTAAPSTEPSPQGSAAPQGSPSPQATPIAAPSTEPSPQGSPSAPQGSPSPQATPTTAPSREPSPQGSLSAPQGSLSAPQGSLSAPQGSAAPQATPTTAPSREPSPQGSPSAPQGSAAPEERRPTADLTTLLPDLGMLEPTDLMIEITPEQRRLLRLTNYIINWGPGKLEILGKSDPVGERTVVFQHLFRANGSFGERAAGIYLYHPLHKHWHFGNFAVYQLWSLTSQGEQDAPVAVMDKVSYCLRDTGRSVLARAAPDPLYTECEAALQGISVGWIDSYEYDLPDQSIDITDLPDGIYALECMVDPGDHLLESDESNNSSVIYVDLRGDTVQVITRAQALDLLAQ